MNDHEFYYSPEAAEREREFYHMMELDEKPSDLPPGHIEEYQNSLRETIVAEKAMEAHSETLAAEWYGKNRAA